MPAATLIRINHLRLSVATKSATPSCSMAARTVTQVVQASVPARRTRGARIIVSDTPARAIAHQHEHEVEANGCRLLTHIKTKPGRERYQRRRSRQQKTKREKLGCADRRREMGSR